MENPTVGAVRSALSKSDLNREHITTTYEILIDSKPRIHEQMLHFVVRDPKTHDDDILMPENGLAWELDLDKIRSLVGVGAERRSLLGKFAQNRLTKEWCACANMLEATADVTELSVVLSPVHTTVFRFMHTEKPLHNPAQETQQ